MNIHPRLQGYIFHETKFFSTKKKFFSGKTFFHEKTFCVFFREKIFLGARVVTVQICSNILHHLTNASHHAKVSAALTIIAVPRLHIHISHSIEMNKKSP